MRYRAGNRICFFRSNIVKYTDFIDQPNQIYGIRLGEIGVSVLDCHLHAMAGVCKASMANSPLHARYRGVECIENSECSLNLAMGRCYLRALVDIEVGEEILWNYGTAYAFED